MFRGSYRLSALLGAFVVLSVAVASAQDADAPMVSEDLPAVRLTYDELFAALREVRSAFVRERRAAAADGAPLETLRLGHIPSGDVLEFHALDEVAVGRLPETCRDVEYKISQFGSLVPVHAVNVSFSSWIQPHVYVHGADGGRKLWFAAFTRGTFARHARAILSHRLFAEIGLATIWMLLSLAYSALAFSRWGRKPSRWVMGIAPTPGLGFALLIWGGESLFPSIVVYRADASWWARHSSDVLLALLVVGVSGLMVVAMRLDWRARARRAAEESIPPTAAVFD